MILMAVVESSAITYHTSIAGIASHNFYPPNP
jgi:hypothetical protein